MIRLIAVTLLFCNVSPLIAQDASGHPPLTLTVTPGSKPKSLHLVLSNTSESPIHLKLGLDVNGATDLEAFSFTIADAHGKRIKFGSSFGFIEGVVSDFSPEIPPGKSWSGDIDLYVLVAGRSEDFLDAFYLPPGSYTVQATYQGSPSVRPVEGRPYWLGIVRSSPTTYVQPQ
jgi:hypothetical protein